MARKIFVSYKHRDNSVHPLIRYANAEHGGQTARAYVDCLEDLFAGNQIYKGEGNEDLSQFKDSTIESRLKDKIHDSSVTVVLISPNMKDLYGKETDQWIPWEVSYSLKEVTRGGKTSLANGVIAVVLPDRYGRYGYYVEELPCGCLYHQTGKLFKILGDNMFNHKDMQQYSCLRCSSYRYPHSYIEAVKWENFVRNAGYYFERAKDRCDHIKDYNITKEIPD